MVCRPSDGNPPKRLAADLEHLEAAGGGAEFADDVVEDVPGHHTVAGLTVQIHPHRRRHLHLDTLVDEGLEQVAAHAHGERAEGAHLGHMTVEMDHKGAGCRIPQLGGDVVTYAQALVHRDAVLLAPVPGVLVQVFFLGRDGRNHVVDKERKPFRFGHLVDTEVLFHLLEDDIGIAGESRRRSRSRAWRGPHRPLQPRRGPLLEPEFFRRWSNPCAYLLEPGQRIVRAGKREQAGQTPDQCIKRATAVTIETMVMAVNGPFCKAKR